MPQRQEAECHLRALAGESALLRQDQWTAIEAAVREYHQPSVICFNTMVAGAGVIELVLMVTGFSGDSPGPNRLGFSFSSGTVRRNALASDGACGICRPRVLRVTEFAPAAGR